MMKNSTHDLRYMRGEQVEVGDVTVAHLPLKAEGHARPIGQVDGAVIDPVARRVTYLVVDMRTGRKLMPLGAARLDSADPSLEVLDPANAEEWERFDSEAFRTYDDEALMTLLFGSHAA